MRLLMCLAGALLLAALSSCDNQEESEAPSKEERAPVTSSKVQRDMGETPPVGPAKEPDKEPAKDPEEEPLPIVNHPPRTQQELAVAFSEQMEKFALAVTSVTDLDSIATLKREVRMVEAELKAIAKDLEGKEKLPNAERIEFAKELERRQRELEASVGSREAFMQGLDNEVRAAVSEVTRVFDAAVGPSQQAIVNQLMPDPAPQEAPPIPAPTTE